MSKRSRDAVGVVKRHPDGFGFFIPDSTDLPDVYIPRNQMAGVMASDRIKVRVVPEPGGDRYRGEVIEIQERAITRVVGELHELNPKEGVLLDKSFAWGCDLKVLVTDQMGAKPGELVVVQVKTYPDSEEGLTGAVVSVIGDAADPIHDSMRVLHAQGIPDKFSEACLRAAERLPLEVNESDFAGREDIRNMPIVTIDGKTAKDFDDAVFVEAGKSGFRLVVAIADVSHYVKRDDPIDQDAVLRGTSTYFPNFVAPMLPEKLSNELCSLKPKVARLAVVADLQLDFQGELVSSKFYEGVIKSHARVTYGQAQEMIDGETVPEIEHVRETILRCADLAKILMNKRMREGSLDLDLPETEIEIDEAGMPVDIMKSERLFSHRLIEELMLMANIAVARALKEKSVASLNRVHEPPGAEAMESFQNFLRAFGYKSKLTGGHLQKQYSKALDHFKGHPKEHILHMLALRSLAQAKYAPEDLGHFGLGFSDYVHFTSPIRRYPDLIIHRQLKAALNLNSGYRTYSQAELETAGSMLSACEQRSVKAERLVKSIKRARFVHQYIGETFEGVISSVTRFGIFVLLRQFDVDGLIRLENLGGDRFEYDEELLRLVGRKSGMTFEIGEPITVVVAKVDVEIGQIDFTLPEDKTSVDRPRRSNEKRGPREKNSQRARGSRVSKPRRPR